MCIGGKVDDREQDLSRAPAVTFADVSVSMLEPFKYRTKCSSYMIWKCSELNENMKTEV